MDLEFVSVFPEIHKNVVNLKSENKVERKRALERLRTSVLEELSENETRLIWDQIHKNLFRSLEDPSERCRELATELIREFYDRIPSESFHLNYLVPILSRRLSNPDRNLNEPSEEIRLQQLELINRLFGENGEFKTNLSPYADELIAICRTALGDSFQDVRVASCRCLVAGVSKLDQFHYSASTFLNPLLKSLSHQQKKVRAAAIQAISTVVQQLYKAEEFADADVGIHLAQRCFDPSPQVRLAVMNCVSDLLLHWRYHSNYSVRLLTILMSSLEDEVPEIAEKTRENWERVAMDWLEKTMGSDSRKEWIKDRLDFDAPLNHYPQGVKRPTFACRYYVSRFFFKILPSTWCDLRDWRTETRVKTSEIMYVLFLHLEADLTEQSVKIIDTLVHGIYDNEPIVVSNLLKAANYYGYFVSPKTWVPLIIERLNSKEANFTTELSILASIIKGSDPQLLRYHLEDLGMTLDKDEICLTNDEAQLEGLFNCITGILNVSKSDCQVIQFSLFKIALVILSLSNNIQSEAREFLKSLAETNGLENVDDLFKNEMGKMLKTFRADSENWGTSSLETHVFATLLQEAGSTVGYFAEFIVGIFYSVLQRNPPPELQLRLFMILSRQLLHNKETLNSQGQFQPYAKKIITDLIIPALKWKAGFKAEAVRTSACSSLWCILESGSLSTIDADLVSSDLFPRMNSLIEDSSQKIRVFITKSYKIIFEMVARDPSSSPLKSEHIIKISSILIKRLDDTSNQVRLSCMEAIIAADACLQGPFPGAEGFFILLLLHMDDDDDLIRTSVYETLKVLAHRNPEKLKEMVSQTAGKHRYKDECRLLQEYLDNFTSS